MILTIKVENMDKNDILNDNSSITSSDFQKWFNLSQKKTLMIHYFLARQLFYFIWIHAFNKSVGDYCACDQHDVINKMSVTKLKLGKPTKWLISLKHVLELDIKYVFLSMIWNKTRKYIYNNCILRILFIFVCIYLYLGPLLVGKLWRSWLNKWQLSIKVYFVLHFHAFFNSSPWNCFVVLMY